MLFDEGSFVEDGRYANSTVATGLPADGVVTGRGSVDGRAAIVVANDPTVKAGSWGARTVEKIVRATESALARGVADLLVRGFGGRSDHRPGAAVPRAGAAPDASSTTRWPCPGGSPQICCLFGPSAAGGAYIPSFTDVLIMVEGNASMYLGSPRMAEMVVGERVSLEEMGGARMHCTVSGVGDLLVRGRHRGHRAGQAVLLLRPLRRGAHDVRRRMPREAAPVPGLGSSIRCRRSRASRSMCTR